LLGHTSGVNDYFEGKAKGRKPLIELALRDRTHRFTVDEMIDFTKLHQTAVGIPGQRFYYSDTGFLILGLIAEVVWKRPLHQVFRDLIFNPLDMKDTGLCFFDPSFQASSLAPVVVNHVELSQAESLSVDWAGGGLYTSTSDLAKLLKAIVSGRLIEPSTFAKMASFAHPFRAGMVYGLGLMEMRFERLFFLLKGLPRLIGHTGILGVHAWIDPLTMDVYVLNVGDASKISATFQLLIQLIMTLQKGQTK
jgi:D-alanyl-D-alanine carboxypeptidase